MNSTKDDMGSDMENIADSWDHPAELAFCEQCDWVYVIPNGLENQICPHCLSALLEPVIESSSQQNQIFYIQPPELLLPFKISLEQIHSRIMSFTQGIPFATPDIKRASSNDRIVQIYLPFWLVDSDINAEWEIEAGYEYEVLSHRERYHQQQGGWQTEQVTEQRVRWEPRLGRLDRCYHNIPVPALEGQRAISDMLGQYDRSDAVPYETGLEQNALIRLPDRNPEDAWGEAKPILQAYAAEECRRASNADQQRNFRWKPEYRSQSWTLLLQPIYATFYRDDDNKPVPIYINGQSGRISGNRRSSLKRGQRASLWILGAAILLFILSIISGIVSFFAPPVLPFAIVCFIAAALIAITSLIPVAIVWQFNRTQRRVEAALP